MIHLGIDNNATGACAALDNQGNLLDWFDTPVIMISKTRRQIDCRGLFNTLRIFVSRLSPLETDFRAWVEKGQPMGQNGSISNFASGLSYGAWNVALSALNISFEVVPAVDWQRKLLRGVTGDSTKYKSLNLANCKWPALPLKKSERARKITMHGRSDAALIAEYGRRLLTVKG